MPAKFTLDVFIAKAKSVHGDIYSNYELIVK